MRLPAMKPVFIIGAQRSGTTFLGSMIGSHDSCLCIPEFPSKCLLCDPGKDHDNQSELFNRIISDWRFKLWGVKKLNFQDAFVEFPGSPGEILEWFVKEYGKKVKKRCCPFWVDHTPTNLNYVDFIANIFPNALFIHLIRDGRAIFASTKKLGWGPGTATHAAKFWGDRIALGLAAESYLGAEKILRIHYEDLVLRPKSVMIKICVFLSLEYHDKMLTGQGFDTPEYTRVQHFLVGSAPKKNRVTGWMNDLKDREIEIFEFYEAQLLKYLGYEPLYGHSASAPSISEKFMEKIRQQYKFNFYQKKIIRKALREYR